MERAIEFSFLPLTVQDFNFTIHRRLAKEGEKSAHLPNCKQAKLPTGVNDEYAKYWYSFNTLDKSEA